MRILTNMRFWQSPTWTAATESIYPGHRLPLGHRPLSPFREALELFRRAPYFDVVVTMGARESLFYALLCILCRKPSKQIACELFVDDPRPPDLLWRLKNKLYTGATQRMLGILTNSTAEIETARRRFGIPLERLRYVPMHTNISEPCASPRDESFALSAGATRRDFETLLRAAEQTTFPIKIICRKRQPLRNPLPARVTVHRDISRDHYLDLLRQCSFAVIPLLPAERATGQVAVLEAMAFGKPVIATQTAGTLDLIRHGLNGLFVPPFHTAALAEAIEKLARDLTLRQNMGRAALDYVLREHTIEIHAARKLAAIAELYNHSRRA